MFRVKVISSNGLPVAVTVQVDTHRKTPSKAAVNDIADRLRLSRGMIDEVLGDWSSEQLRTHLSALTREQLCSRTPIE